MNISKSGMSVAGEGAQREKYWSELTSEEQIGRIRMVVKNLMQQIENLSRQHYQQSEQFRRHQHVDGKLMMEMNMFGNEVATGSLRVSSPEDPEKVYF